MSSRAAATERIVQGPLGRELLRFGTPLAIGMGLQTAFNLLDAYLIGHLEAGVAGPALGAIGICDQLAALGSIISYGLTVASCALVSQHQGARNDAQVARVTQQSILLILALSVAFGLLGTAFARPLVEGAVGAKGRVVELSVPYLRVMMGGSFSIFLLLHATSVLRALGSSKTPVTLLVLANALNVLLAVVMIFGPGPTPALLSFGPPIARWLGIPRMGLMGAAWATLIARTVMLVPLGLILYKRLPRNQPRFSFRFDFGVLREIFALGWASSAQLVVRILAMLFTHALVARSFTTDADQTATTALGVVFRLETMALFVGLGWGSAAQTFVGQNLGAGNFQRAKHSGWYAALFNAAMMAGLTLLYLKYGDFIVRLFTDEPEVVRVAHEYLWWVSPSYVALGVGVALGSAIQGAGATRRALLLDGSVVVLFQLPVCLFAVVRADGSPIGLWQSVAATYAALALVHVISYWRSNFVANAPKSVLTS